MTTETKSFPTLEVLSSITGRLVCDIGGVYKVLGYMAGEELFTHQLPRVAQEARLIALKHNPALRQAIVEAEEITKENWREWAARWVERYGPRLSVPRMSSADHETKDPISELEEMTGKPPIVVVVP